MTDAPLIPEELLDLLTTNRLGHVSTRRPEGSIATHLMWIDWDGEHVLTSSAVGSRKGRNWRANPEASVSVADPDDDWRYVVIRGRVTDVRPDVGLEFIDRMALRYTGNPYRWRDSEREIFVITPDHIRVSGGARG